MSVLSAEITTDSRKAQQLKLQAAIYRVEAIIEKESYKSKAVWRNFWRLAEKEFGSLKLVADLIQELGYELPELVNMFFQTGDSTKDLWSQFADAGLTWRQVVGCLQSAKRPTGSFLSEQEQIYFILNSGLTDEDKIGALAFGGYLSAHQVHQLFRSGISRDTIIYGLIGSKTINTQIYRMLCALPFGDDDQFCSERHILRLLRQCALSDEEKFCALRNVGFSLSDIMKLFPTVDIGIRRVLEVFINCGVPCGTIALTYQSVADNNANLVKVLSEPPFDSVLTDDLMLFKTLDDFEVDLELFARMANQADWRIKRIIKVLVDAGRTEDAIRGMIANSERLGRRKNSVQFAYWNKDNVARWRQACDSFFGCDIGEDIDDLFGHRKPDE